MLKQFTEKKLPGPKLQPDLERCLQLGFRSPRYYSFENLRRDTRTSFISLLHSSGEFSVRLMHSMGTQVNPPVENQLVVVLSELSDGTYFFTSDQKAKFKSAPGISGNRLIGADVARLVDAHKESLAALRLKNPPKLTPSIEQLDELWDRYEKHSTNFGVQRGLYVPMSPEEVEHEQQILTGATAMMAGSGEHADVLIQLSALQNQKAGWGSAMVILLVSLGLFVGAGARQWSWEFLLILLPVLFIHELGHYLAMRVFNYRNLRMFFIPFFGAAVSGQHFNVAGWKKVIVSLMGPVPGIILGVIIGGAGLLLHHALLTKVAVLTLILNGFNLLPVLPFDGGWVFHTLLFSRHYLLDTAFRVLAAIALLVGGMLSQNKILMYLSIPMFISIPATFRMARIATTLRERGVPPASADDQTIPAETAQAIIGEVKKANVRLPSNKMLAQ